MLELIVCQTFLQVVDLEVLEFLEVLQTRICDIVVENVAELQVSQTAGVNIEGRFTSSLLRNTDNGLAEDFRFDAPINHVNASPPVLH